jgi:two-component system cell cycle sensor histidine kinase/response regulator CckA
MNTSQRESPPYFASGIAHDLNNILCNLLIQADLLMISQPKEDNLLAGIKQLQKSIERGCLLTKQLLAFNQKEIIAPKMYKLNELISEMAPMLRILSQIKNELVFISKAEDDTIEAIPGQLEQVLLNLVSNAKDALLQGGTIKISTQNTLIDEKNAQKLNLKEGSYIILAVSDDGIGMDESTREHIFKPFFTTKSQGKGHGLGLTTVERIVAQLHGHIKTDSQIDKGTTFSVYIPLSNSTRVTKV